MPLHANAELLKTTLEAIPSLDGRYSALRMVNYDAGRDAKRGCFSLVFRANDQATGKTVALKFYDVTPEVQRDKYRRASFHRECEILEQLLTVDRCLQLASSMRTFDLPVPGGGGASLPCEYFAVDWLDGELDDFFLGRASSNAVDKLRLFNEIVLSIEALHNHEVFHRDIKADNLRAYSEGLRRIVVAIDLGTAARCDSGCLLAGYGGSVGAPAYAAPEATAGLAGNRLLAPYNDLYAMGCLLFELFNPDYFYQALHLSNPGLGVRVAAMAGAISAGMDQQRERVEWNAELDRMAKGVLSVSADGFGSQVPKCIAGIISDVVQALTAFDYRRRPIKLSYVRQKIWTAIRVLQNEAEAKRRTENARSMRSRRVEKARRKADRLESYLRNRMV